MKKLFKKSSTKRVVAVLIAFAVLLSSSVLTATAVKHVELKDGTRELTLKTYTTDTHAILSQANIKLDSYDKIRKTKDDNKIYLEVLRAFPVHITYRNLEHVEFVTGGTVSDVLKKAQINLTSDDVINHSGDTLVYDHMDIVIEQVKYITKSETKEIKFETKYKNSDDYSKGYEEVISKGKNGKKEITKTYKYVNGELDGAVNEVEEIIAKPKNKVILKGTAEVVQTSNFDNTKSQVQENNTAQSKSEKKDTSTSGNVKGMSYSKVLTGSATAYTASSGALTSTGVPAYVGGVAVNPNVIPYGSKLYIEADGYTYGYATAVDTGGALMSGSALVDLYMSSYDECINFGRRNVKVYVLD